MRTTGLGVGFLRRGGLVLAMLFFLAACAGEGGGTIGTPPDPGTPPPDNNAPDVQADATDAAAVDAQDVPVIPPCEPVTGLECASFEDNIQPIFKEAGCSDGGCHSTEFGLSPILGMNLMEGFAYDTTVNVASAQNPLMMRIAPGDVENSYLLLKVTGTALIGDPMPKEIGGLDADSVAALTNWVQACAPNGSYGDCAPPDVTASDVGDVTADVPSDVVTDVVAPDTTPDPGTSDTSDTTADANDTATVDVPADPGTPMDTAPPDAGPPPTYAQIQSQVLQLKCVPCHTDTPCSSNDCFVDTFSDTTKSAAACGGIPLYQCMLNRVLAGSMPRQKGCTGNPDQDQNNSDCLNAEQLELLTNWVTAGGPQ